MLREPEFSPALLPSVPLAFDTNLDICLLVWQKFKFERSRTISRERDDRHLNPFVRNLCPVLCDSGHHTRCRGIRLCAWPLQETQISTDYLRHVWQQDKPAQKILRGMRSSSIELYRICSGDIISVVLSPRILG